METLKTKSDLKERTKKRILPTLLFSAVMPFIICVCIPFEVFANNIEQFVFAVKDFLPLSILIGVAATAIFFFTLLYLPPKAYKIVAAIYVGFALMFFIQGNYLNAGVHSLAGDGLGEEIPLIKKIFNLLIWLAVIGGAIFLALYEKWHDITSMVSIGLCAVIMLASFMSPVALSITTENVFKTKAERVKLSGEEEFSILTTENLTTISSDKNVFIFLVDVMDNEYVAETFEKRPEIFHNLDGFTYFEDNTSIYGHTFPSVSNMLTGAHYDVRGERSHYLNNAYQNAVPLDILNENDYQISIYSKGYYAYDDANYFPDYVSNVSEALTTDIVSPFELSGNMLLIALFRTFPLLLKPLVGKTDSAITNTYVICQDEEGRYQYSTNLKRAWNYIQDSIEENNGEFTVTDEKVFSFIHTYGCHSIEFDENWERPRGEDRDDITLSMMHSFNIIDEYIDAMKKAGSYKDATLIIMGDHGIPKNNLTELDDPMQTGMFIKPSGQGVEGEGFKTSTAQTSHAQLWETIFDSEDITLTAEQQTAYSQTTFPKFNKTGKSHFEINEGETNERFFYWHTYMGGNCDEFEYKILGNGNDLDNWDMLNHIQVDKYIMN